MHQQKNRIKLYPQVKFHFIYNQENINIFNMVTHLKKKVKLYNKSLNLKIIS